MIGSDVSHLKGWLRRIAAGILAQLIAPTTFYFVAFFLLTFPLMGRFSTHFLGDDGDGLQNVWNVWWVDYSVTHLHRSPWHTDYLHYPYGISLLGHTLTAVNGLMCIPLMRPWTLVEAYNFAVIFSFVASGVTAFWLAYYLSRSYVASLLAGYLFTFSSFHFGHASGHLNFLTIEWIPLFVLFGLKLVARPRVLTALGCAASLWFVLISEYNFYFYCLLFGGMLLVWNAYRLRRPLFFLDREYRIPLVVLLLAVLASSGPLVIPLMRLNATDPLVGAHAPGALSMDLMAPFVPGRFSRFAERTSGLYWSKLPADNALENNVYLGLSVIALLIYLAWNVRRSELKGTGLWFFVFVFFTILCLGPQLRVRGQAVWDTMNMPYAWLESVIPPLKVSGAPTRMAIMSSLAASILCAGAFKLLLSRGRVHQVVAVLLLPIMAVELLPKPIPTTEIPIPEYVRMLRELPGDGVLDAQPFSYTMVSKRTDTRELVEELCSWTQAMYHQTWHHKRIAFGYVPRVPRSVKLHDAELAQAFINQDFEQLWKQYGIRYLAISDVPDSIRNSPFLKLLHEDAIVCLFDLGSDRPEFRDVAVSLVPSATKQMTWEGKRGISLGDDPFMVIPLAKPTFVHAIRVECAYETPGAAQFQLYWQKSGDDGFIEERSKIRAIIGGNERQSVTIVVNEFIDKLRIDPDSKPGVFQISEVTLVVPDGVS